MYGIAFLFGILGTGAFVLWASHSFAEKERLRNERDILEENLRAEDERKKVNDKLAGMSANDKRVQLKSWSRPVPRAHGHPSDGA